MDLVVVVQDYILRILEEAGPGMKVSFLIGCGLWVLKIPGSRIRLRLNKFEVQNLIRYIINIEGGKKYSTT